MILPQPNPSNEKQRVLLLSKFIRKYLIQIDGKYGENYNIQELESKESFQCIIINHRSHCWCSYSKLIRLYTKIFNVIYKKINGIDLVRDAPSFRMLSRSVINFISQHPDPALSYRHIPALSGFKSINLQYKSNKTVNKNK